MVANKSEWLEAVPAYLAGELTSAERTAFAERLAADAGLRRELEATRTVLTQLKAAPAQRSSRDLAPEILHRIRAPAPKRLVWRWLPAAAAAALIIAVAYLQLTAPPDRSQPDNDPVTAARLQACEWLARNQSADGGWDLGLHRSVQSHTVGITGLALMALAEGGPRFKDEARRAVRYLVRQQDASGRFGPRTSKAMYNHGVVTMALLKARKRFDLAEAKPALDQALAFMIQAQTDGGGWGYFGISGELPNTAVTTWQIQALYAAAALGWEKLVRPALDQGLRYVRAQVDAEDHLTYSGGRGSRALDAMGAFCLLLDRNADARAQGRRVLARIAGEVDAHPDVNGRADPYLSFFLSRAVLASRDEAHASLRRASLQALLKHQVTEGYDAGSFANAAPWSRLGGTVYTTAMAALSLQGAL